MNKLFILAAMLIFLVQAVSAYTYLNIYIDQAGNAEFLGETNETLFLPNGISLQDGKIRGTTQALTSKQEETWTFSFSLRNAEIKAILPEGAAIQSIDANNEEIFIERGRISVYFTDNMTIRYIVNNQTGSNWLIWILILAALGTAGYFYRAKILNFFQPKVIYKKSRIKRGDKLAILKQVLNEREKLILDKLKQAGKIKMSHLRKLTEIPKASFSRHVQELEKKGLVKRLGEGKNKFVQLVKKI